MTKELGIAARVSIVTLLVTGLVYPLLTTAAALVLFPSRARGSIVADEQGHAIGSELIGQAFASPAYLQGRPSASGYDAQASGGSNLGPTSKALRERADKELARLRGENPGAPGEVPAELVSASGSGLDPHLSPAAAAWEAPRVSRARRLSLERVLAVIETNTEGRDLGFLGEPRVNVLLVNLALDRQFGRPAK